MKPLLIFDHSIDLVQLQKKIVSLEAEFIYLLPLTSDWKCIRGVKEVSQSANIAIEVIESARLLDDEVGKLGESVIRWSADLGELKVRNRSLKSRFLLPKSEVSTWWFSLLSEKNPRKTDIFLRIAQLQIIDKVISQNNIKACICSLVNSDLSTAVTNLCRRSSIDILSLASVRGKSSFKQRLVSQLKRAPDLYYGLKALGALGKVIVKTTMTKLVMGPIKPRLGEYKNSIMFISYFPLLDKDAASKGKIKNRYVMPLQEKLSAEGKPIIWVWMYTFLEGYSFKQALNLASRFKNKGEINFLLEEFISLKLFLKTLFLWLRQIITFVKLRLSMPKDCFYKNFSIPETSLFLEKLFVESFLGPTSFMTILYFEIYKKIFSSFSGFDYCVYFFEMQAWEKALNAAKKIKAPAIKTIGFQHTLVHKNFFPYFCWPSELASSESSPAIPLPDILACNGDVSKDVMSSWGYKDIRKVEALRQLYLSPSVNYREDPKNSKIILILGSANKKETRALISLFSEAFPRLKGIEEVWVKGHPCMPVEEILRELDLFPKESRYSIKKDSVGELAQKAGLVFVSGSSAVLEALALGCKVISPVFVDDIFMNPLGETNNVYLKVYNPYQLREEANKIIMQEAKESEQSSLGDFIGRYWCLDNELPRWKELLALKK